MSSLKAYLLNLNLFKASTYNNEEDDHQQRSNIISTRVYLVLLVLALLGLSLGLSLSLQATKFVLPYPSLTQFKTLSTDAQCPCSHTSISYDQFTLVKAMFHQVCSSDFVSDRWIETIFFGSNSSDLYAEDFRVIGSSLFRALASFCFLSETTVRKNLVSFNATPFISPQVLSQVVLESEVNANIEKLKLTMTNTFVSQLQLVHEMTFGNRLVSALLTNVYFFYEMIDMIWVTHARFYYYLNQNASRCYCYIDLDCHVSSGIYDPPGEDGFINVLEHNVAQLMKIPGFSAGCLPVNSLLQSTLECFYDQLCLDELLSFISTNESFTAMTFSEHSRFNLNSTIKSILEFIMVEQWTTNISYEKYYAQCAPISCIYSTMKRHDFMLIMAEVIGLLGGLTPFLEFFVPMIVRFARRQRNHNLTPRISLFTRFCQLKTRVTRFFVELNLFEHEPNNDRHIQFQRIATRFYIVVLIISLVITTIYLSLTEETYRETVFNPTESQYTHLQELYPNNLVCPCTSLSVFHKTLISINPVYHQICTSDFVSSLWLNFLAENEYWYFELYYNYRASTGSQFKLLATLCQSAQHMVNNSLGIFFETQFVSSHVVSQQVFDSEVNSLIEDWKLSTTNKFLHTIQLIQETNQGNRLMNDFFNFNIEIDSMTGQVSSVPLIYSNCSCALSDACHSPMLKIKFAWAAIPGIVGTIPNFFTGCSPMKALLQSTLECFYNQTCVNMVATFKDFSTSINVSRLDESRNSPNETIESIVNQLMVDEWQSNISFTSYYNTCAPTYCIFEYRSRRSLLIFITTILGIYGGLSVGFEILVLICLRLAEKIIGSCSRLTMMQLIRNPFICRNEQQIARRLHFILIVTALSTLYLAIFLTPRSKTTLSNEPSLSTYQNLATYFPNFLQCSCSQIGIPYHSFLDVESQFHEVCSSEFVTDRWITYVYDQGNLYNHTDFRATSVNHFQLLASFCRLSKETLNNSLWQLKTTDYIDVQLSTPNMFNKQIQATIRKFQLAASNSLVSTLDLIRRTTEANMLMNAHFTNWKFNDANITGDSGLLQTTPVNYQECNCGLSLQCIQSSGGMMTGCYPLEALLRSTFECFYDQECIDFNGIFKALNSFLIVSSRFATNATIEFILNELMVENYSINISYENYFAQCAPMSCSYSYIQRYTSIDILTSLISLYGGVVIISQWIVSGILQLRQHRIRKINPQNIVQKK